MFTNLCKKLFPTSLTPISGCIKDLDVLKIKQTIFLSLCAYKSKIDISKFTESEFQEPPIFYNDNTTDVQAISTKTKDTMFIAFRGSTTMTDFMHDFMMFMVPFIGDKGNVHRGFYTQFLAISNNLKIDIDTWIDSIGDEKDKTIVFCGHSLGSSLATIASAYFGSIYKNKNNNIKIQLYAYGSPRCGDAKFVKFTESIVDSYYRVVNKKDPVCEYPTIYPYSHIGNCIHLNEHGKFNLSSFDTPLQYRILHLMNFNVQDHLISEYMHSIHDVCKITFYDDVKN